MLNWTGHPLVDVGIAAVTAFCGQSDPAALTETDLTAATSYLARLYTQNRAMRGHAEGIVFHNSPYVRGSDPEARAAYIAEKLYGWRDDAPALAESCAFCGRPSAYRASRRDVPMLNGQAVINFSPAGRAGLPVCGACSLALHMLPLGCVKCGGSLLAAHSPDPALTLALAREALERMLPLLALPDLDKLPGVKHEKTRLIALLLRWADSAGRAAPVTGYVFSNSGTAPDMRIYPISSAIVGFLRAVRANPDGTLIGAWDRAVARAWGDRKKSRLKAKPSAAPKKRAPKAAAEPVDLDQESNGLFEALIALPANAAWLLRRYLLPVRHWGLIELYLRMIMNLDKERIDLLRALGDRFAEYAARKRVFFFQFARAGAYDEFRRALLRAADDTAREGKPIITFDEFIEVFTAPSGEYNDWRLMRDLIALRMLERGVIAEDEFLFEDEESALTSEEERA
jgi:CRISPR-associated protein Cst1